jgi:hypothetical protein
LQGEETARLGVGLALGLDLLAQSGDELGCAVQCLEGNAPFWSAFPTLFAHRTPHVRRPYGDYRSGSNEGSYWPTR